MQLYKCNSRRWLVYLLIVFYIFFFNKCYFDVCRNRIPKRHSVQTRSDMTGILSVFNIFFFRIRWWFLLSNQYRLTNQKKTEYYSVLAMQFFGHSICSLPLLHFFFRILLWIFESPSSNWIAYEWNFLHYKFHFVCIF